MIKVRNYLVISELFCTFVAQKEEGAYSALISQIHQTPSSKV